MIRDALLHPDRFFGERTPRPSLGTAAVVVFVVALVSTATVGFAVSGTLAVAAWGTLPTLFQAVVGGASLYFAIQGMEFSGSPEMLAQQFQRMASRTQSGNLAVSAFVTLWQAYVWTYGLKHVRNLETGSAAGAAGVVAFVSFVLAAV